MTLGCATVTSPWVCTVDCCWCGGLSDGLLIQLPTTTKFVSRLEKAGRAGCGVDSLDASLHRMQLRKLQGLLLCSLKVLLHMRWHPSPQGATASQTGRALSRPCSWAPQCKHVIAPGLQDMDEELQSYHASNTELDQANGDLRTQLARLRQEAATCQHSLRILGAQHRCPLHSASCDTCCGMLAQDLLIPRPAYLGVLQGMICVYAAEAWPVKP